MHLPSAQYVDVAQKMYYPDEGAVADVYTSLLTDRYSSVPVIAVTEDEGCASIFLVNRTNPDHPIVVEHTPNPGMETVEELYERLSPSPDDVVDVIILGMAESENNPDPDHKTLEGIKDALAWIDRKPNLRLAIFDVAHKPHPTAFAIDATMVPDDPDAPIPVLRGTELVTNLEEALTASARARSTHTIMQEWHVYSHEHLADGEHPDFRGR